VSHLKDPAVTVKAESEGCWLYVKLDKSADFDAYCAFEIESGWTMLPSDNTVFFRQVENTEADQVFRVLKDDRVTVHETLTEEILNAMTVFPTLTFTAFAIQSEGVSTPQDGWQILNS
jgi:hypothetical protein